MTSQTKFYHVIQIILQMWSCEQSLVTLAFLWEKLSLSQFYKVLTKSLFLRGGLISREIFGTDTSYKLEIVHQCVKMVKTKSQKVLRAKSYVCRPPLSWRGLFLTVYREYFNITVLTLKFYLFFYSVLVSFRFIIFILLVILFSLWRFGRNITFE